MLSLKLVSSKVVVPRACPGYTTPCGLPRLFEESSWLYEAEGYTGEWASRCPNRHVWVHPEHETFEDE